MTLPGSGSFKAELPYSNSTWANPPGVKSQLGKAAYSNNFFSGNNVFVFLFPYYKKMYIPIPVVALSYGMTQEKVPIYGAWSYTFDAIARGNRIVKGEMALVFTYPNMLGELIGEGQTSIYPTETDPKTKDKYQNQMPTSLTDAEAAKATLRKDIWGVGNDQYLTSPYKAGNKNGTIKSAFPFGQAAPAGKPEADYAGHPPFDIVICYGDNPDVQNINNDSFDFDTWALSAQDAIKMTSGDYNEQVNPSWGVSKRIHLKNVELLSSGTQIDITGQPLQETYSFIARDAVVPISSNS